MLLIHVLNMVTVCVSISLQSSVYCFVVLYIYLYWLNIILFSVKIRTITKWEFYSDRLHDDLDSSLALRLDKPIYHSFL